MTSDHSRPDPDAGALSVVVLDVANVMGSRPDGWWRDRAGAATRLLEGAATVCAAPHEQRGGVAAVVGVLEGTARAADHLGGDGVQVVRAPGAGDDTIVEVTQRCVEALDGLEALDRPLSPGPAGRSGPRDGGGPRVVVVTADRGLRARLPPAADAVGPAWWWDLVEGCAGPGSASRRGGRS